MHWRSPLDSQRKIDSFPPRLDRPYDSRWEPLSENRAERIPTHWMASAARTNYYFLLSWTKISTKTSHCCPSWRHQGTKLASWGYGVLRDEKKWRDSLRPSVHRHNNLYVETSYMIIGTSISYVNYHAVRYRPPKRILQSVIPFQSF